MGKGAAFESPGLTISRARRAHAEDGEKHACARRGAVKLAQTA